MRKKVKKAVSGQLAGARMPVRCVLRPMPSTRRGMSSLLHPQATRQALSSPGITDAAVHDGTVTIPDELNGTPVKVAWRQKCEPLVSKRERRGDADTREKCYRNDPVCSV